MGFEIAKSSGEEKLDGKARRFFRNANGELVDADSSEGVELAIAYQQEQEEKMKEQNKRRDLEISDESKVEEATFARETALIRDKIQNSLQVELEGLDQSLNYENNETIVNFDVKAMADRVIAKKKRREDVLMEIDQANKEFYLFAKGVVAWRAGQPQDPRFVEMIGRLEGEAAKSVELATDPSRPEYRTTRLRMTGLAEIRKKLEGR